MQPGFQRWGWWRRWRTASWLGCWPTCFSISVFLVFCIFCSPYFLYCTNLRNFWYFCIFCIPIFLCFYTFCIPIFFMFLNFWYSCMFCVYVFVVFLYLLYSCICCTPYYIDWTSMRQWPREPAWLHCRASRTMSTSHSEVPSSWQPPKCWRWLF